MADTERHVKRFVFGRLLPVRGVDHVWERRYGWHWVVEREQYNYSRPPVWRATAWLHEAKPKRWVNQRNLLSHERHGYQPKEDGREGGPPGPE